ncbi:MAG: ArsR family transcriptional regulator [Myxococcales bacterium]|nr:ArsR family transcriptional regulator [Myxococcales bacterium]
MTAREAASDDRIVKMLKALGHPNRFRLFVEILKGASSYEDGHTCLLTPIIARLNIGAPTVSHHLKELVHAELVTTARDGKFLACRVNPDALARLQTFFQHATTQEKKKK